MLQLFLFLFIVPALLGRFIQSLTREEKNENFLFFFSLGFLIMVAEFALVCYPATWLDVPFHSVSLIIECLYAAESLSVLLWLYVTHHFNIKALIRKSSFATIVKSPAFWIMILICGFQIGRLMLIGPAEARDSKTYCALIIDILQSDHLFIINPENGIPLSSVFDMDLKYSLSAWYPFIAMLAKTSHLHPLIIHNTVLPPYLLLMHYLILYSLGYLLFEKKTINACMFTALCSFIYELTLYCHTPTMIKLVWPVWGKGVLSMTVVPALLVFYMIYISKESQTKSFPWIWQRRNSTVLSPVPVARKDPGSARSPAS